MDCSGCTELEELEHELGSLRNMLSKLSGIEYCDDETCGDCCVFNRSGGCMGFDDIPDGGEYVRSPTCVELFGSASTKTSPSNNFKWKCYEEDD